MLIDQHPDSKLLAALLHFGQVRGRFSAEARGHMYASGPWTRAETRAQGRLVVIDVVPGTPAMCVWAADSNGLRRPAVVTGRNGEVLRDLGIDQLHATALECPLITGDVVTWARAERSRTGAVVAQIPSGHTVGAYIPAVQKRYNAAVTVRDKSTTRWDRESFLVLVPGRNARVKPVLYWPLKPVRAGDGSGGLARLETWLPTSGFGAEAQSLLMELDAKIPGRPQPREIRMVP